MLADARRPFRRSRRRAGAAARATLAGGAALAVAVGLMALAPAEAHDGSSGGNTEAAGSVECPPGQERLLEGAGDNFDLACLPGQDISGLDDSDALLTSSNAAKGRNLTLLSNTRKTGAFADSFNTDLAFKGNYAYAGNYNGFVVWNIANPKKPRSVAQIVCPGAQNDVSVAGNLLVLSVDSSRNNDSCSSVEQSPALKESWEGIRVFDISKPAKPQYVAAVETDCGSHTHTLAPTRDGKNVFVYVSSYSPSDLYPDCKPPHDKISVVKIPTAAPQNARVVAKPALFPGGGYPGSETGSATSGCHDLTAYPSKNVMAGACMGDGILLDISNRTAPKVTARTRDTRNFAFWHSATFNNDATKVVFTDELGGGGGATCNRSVGPKRGADGIYDIVAGKLKFRSYYKMPRTQTNTENCVAHNGSLVPVKGKDIMVQAWYQGGISVFDFTNSAKPREIAWFDRGPVNADELEIGGPWSSYYYNGYVYSNEIARGFDVLDLTAPGVAGAENVKFDVFNPQSQPSY